MTLCGWVRSWRDHGGLLFVDVGDRSGVTQIVFSPERSAELHAEAERLRDQFVIAVTGTVSARPEGIVNPNLLTGEIEVYADRLEVLNAADPPAFEMADDAGVSPDVRLRSRFLDLRRPRMQRNLLTRHRVVKGMRDYFDAEGFIEVETPMLTRSTPEGARDYLVPSRVNPGTFYALPQSPQLFKQILMVSGVDRYFQIARCFRDEDLRADRQPEFTQLDVEMSFVDEEDVIATTDGLLATLFREVLGVEIATPIDRITYDQAMADYGVDAPDVRFGMKLRDVSDVAAECGFGIFSSVVKAGGTVRGIAVEGGADLSRRQIDELGEFVKEYGAKGLAWMKVTEDGVTGPIAKFFDDGQLARLRECMGASAGDLMLFVADQPDVVCAALGALRVRVARDRGLLDASRFALVWVTDFPLMGLDEEGNVTPLHHPFTAPAPGDLDKLERAPLEVRSRAYDIVLNGIELGGGSIRIHDSRLQERVLKMLDIDAAQAEAKFGFLLRALKSGAPPHGGIALGIDRLVMLLLGEDSIREVIAFPKTARAQCLMSSAPAHVDEAQLKELGLSLETTGEDAEAGGGDT